MYVLTKKQLNEVLNEIYRIHDVDVNQLYDKQYPYSIHLKGVVAQVHKYKGSGSIPNNLIDGYSELETFVILCLGAAGHDLNEDARMTYNDIAQRWGTPVADIIYCCTDEKGRNRDERHSDKFFEELAANRGAVFVKLCDTTANVLFSMLTNSSMYKKYQKEFPRLYAKLYRSGEFDAIWDDLRGLLKQ